ncbi:acyl-CoA dehydrogenase family protein [Streptomyces sp. L7]
MFAKTDPGRGSSGVTAFLLRKGAEGDEVRRAHAQDGAARDRLPGDLLRRGLRARVQTGSGCRGAGPPAGSMRGSLDISRDRAGRRGDRERPSAAYEYALKYARERKQFGKPIVEHQAVAFRLADMATRIESAWLLTLHAARQLAGRGSGRDEGRRHGQAPGLGDRDGGGDVGCRPDPRRVGVLTGSSRSSSGCATPSWREIEEGTSDIMRLIISRRL